MIKNEFEDHEQRILLLEKIVLTLNETISSQQEWIREAQKAIIELKEKANERNR